MSLRYFALNIKRLRVQNEVPRQNEIYKLVKLGITSVRLLWKLFRNSFYILTNNNADMLASQQTCKLSLKSTRTKNFHSKI